MRYQHSFSWLLFQKKLVGLYIRATDISQTAVSLQKLFDDMGMYNNTGLQIPRRE